MGVITARLSNYADSIQTPRRGSCDRRAIPALDLWIGACGAVERFEYPLMSGHAVSHVGPADEST